MITRADSNGLFHERWYTDADAYWSRIDATDDGMLGGLAMVHRPDIQQSRAFIRALMASGKLALERRRACGRMRCD